MTSPFSIPVEIGYNGRKQMVVMGPFEHSTEREFALAVNKKAIQECTSLEQLKPAATNLLEGWTSMQTAFQSMMLENIQLRQALAKKEIDLRAADEILDEAAKTVERLRKKCDRQSRPSIWRLLPW